MHVLSGFRCAGDNERTLALGLLNFIARVVGKRLSYSSNKRCHLWAFPSLCDWFCISDFNYTYYPPIVSGLVLHLTFADDSTVFVDLHNVHLIINKLLIHTIHVYLLLLV